MKMHLPPTLFDIQFHHLVHFPGEVGLCGPISTRWMYFVERYMGELKGRVRQCTRPEGSMAQGYLIAETMHYVSEYLERFHSQGPKLFDVSGNDKFSRIVLPKSKTTKVMFTVFREQAWRFLLLNTACLEPWRQHHALEQEAAHNTIPFKEWQLPAVRAEVEDSMQKPNQMVWDLAVGPAANANFFTACWAYGCYFRVASRDLTKKTTFDYGISQWFEIEEEQKEYIGYVVAIVRLDFDSFETVFIKAKWYNIHHSRGRSSTLVEDECRHLRVKVVDFIPDSFALDEPFVFSKDVEQLFFVDDWIHAGWKLVVKVEARGCRVCYQRSSPITVESDEEDNNSPEEGVDPIPMDSADPRSLRGCLHGLVSTTADDIADEDYDSGESEEDDELQDHASGHSESNDNGQVATLRRNINDGLHCIMEEQWEELESDGEIKDVQERSRRRRLHSAT